MGETPCRKRESKREFHCPDKSPQPRESGGGELYGLPQSAGAPGFLHLLNNVKHQLMHAEPSAARTAWEDPIESFGASKVKDFFAYLSGWNAVNGHWRFAKPNNGLQQAEADPALSLGWHAELTYFQRLRSTRRCGTLAASQSKAHPSVLRSFS
jgi:hypothetical protein